MLGFVVAALLQCPDGTPSPCSRAAARAGPPPTSVAVMYFDNQSRDSGDAYLADGLTEQTIARLGDVGRLTVSSRFAVRRFRGGASDPATVGRQLNVANLVVGSVQRASGRLRVTVELVRAASGQRVWGDTYDRTDADLLVIQDDIAEAVANGIVGRLLPAERRVVAARPTRVPAAWDHFLRGNYLLARRTAASFTGALREFDAAALADPRFTDAIARIAYTYALVLDNEVDIGLTRDSLIILGTRTAERAIRADSLSSEAWLADAYMRMSRFPRTLEGVRESFERALRLNPRNAEAHHQHAWYIAAMGDYDSARAENLRALAIEPGRAITMVQLMGIDHVQGRRNTAAWLDSIEAADSLFITPVVFMAAIGDEDTATARRAARKLMAVPEFRDIGALLAGYLLIHPGDSAAGGWMRSMALGLPAVQPNQGTQNVYGSLTGLLARIGDGETALLMLERASPRGAILNYGMRWRIADPVRADPRYQRIFEESRPPGALR